jgi:hypothetical protein
MEFAIGPDGGDRLEILCAGFRHGSTRKFEAIARIDPRTPAPFNIDVDLTAANQREMLRRTFSLECVHLMPPA